MEKEEKSSFSFSVFKETFQQEFLHLISNLNGSIKIVFPRYLTTFITQSIPLSISSQHNFSFTTLPSIQKDTKDISVVYITPPEEDLIQQFLEHFDKLKKATKVIFAIPQTNAFIETLIENTGYEVTHNAISKPEKQVLVADFHCDFLPVETDFFLLPSKNSFSKIFFEENQMQLFYSARALAKIQSVSGKIPHIMTIGEKSQQVKEIMLNLVSKAEISPSVPVIDAVLIIDRMSDLITPLYIMTTIEGMLDEVVGINYGGLFIPDSKDTLLMTNNSPIFASYRDNGVANPDFDIINELKNAADELKSIKPQGVSMQEFTEKVKRINKLKPYKEIIDKHVNLLEKVYAEKAKDSTHSALLTAEFNLLWGESCSTLAEQLITLKQDWRSAFKLLILEACTNITHKKKFYQTVRNMCIAHFGPQVIESLAILDEFGLFSAENKFPADWKNIQENLVVTEKPKIVENQNVYKTQLMNVLDGYVPISLKLIYNCVSNNAKVLQSITQNKTMKITVSTSPDSSKNQKSSRKVLVLFVGGVTLTVC